MTRFNYTAEKGDGEVYKGTAEAVDRFELYKVVRREGGRIVSMEEGAAASTLSLDYWIAKLGRVSEYEKVLFARNLGAMLSAGLALARALAVIERQTRNPKFSAIISQLGSDVRHGETMHAALAKFPKVFPTLFVAMVRAGEEGGDMPGSFAVVADQMERMYALKKKIKGALMYPGIIVVAMLGIGSYMMVSVVPTLAATFKEMKVDLPLSTQTIMWISDFLVHNMVASAIGLVLFVLAWPIAARTEVGKRTIDWILLHTPVINNIVRELNAARTGRTLASLLTSGVDILTSLEITHEVVQNTYFRDVIKDAQRGVGQGEPLSVSFTRREDLYPAFVGEMMSVGEETGQTNEMLKRLALYYEEEVDRKTKDMSTIIEPFLMVFIGGAVGFFAVSMITPIYQISQNM